MLCLASLCLVLSIVESIATPIHTVNNLNQVPFDLKDLSQKSPSFPEGHHESNDTRQAAMSVLLDKYAPIIKLSSREEYFPSSVEYMLPHFAFIEADNGTLLPLDEDILTPSRLDDFPKQGGGLFLSIAEPHNPQPMLDETATYLFGPAGQEGGMKRDENGRGIVKEPIYGFWVDKGRGLIDLWYWTYYPYNFGKLAGPLGVVGNHVGDWEHIRVRTINGTATSVDYHAHNGGPLYAGTLRWEDAPKIDGRPVAYSAAGSHGLWSTPGDHALAPVLNLFKVVDMTDDDGAIWDSKGMVVPIQYWENSDNRSKVHHTGDQAWVNFRGHYGNAGDEQCWFNKILRTCQVGDAPPGPNRWFGSIPECLIAPASEDKMSTYNFYLSKRTAAWAEMLGIQYIQVEQICQRSKKDKDNKHRQEITDGGSDFHAEDNNDVDTYITTGTTKYMGRDRHSVTTMPCTGMQAAVKSYRIAFCLADGTCIAPTGERSICTYQEGMSGFHPAPAINLEDLDEWTEP